MEKVVKVATTLSTTIAFLAQLVAPAEQLVLEHIQHLRTMGEVEEYINDQRYQHLAKQLDLLQQQLTSLQG